MSRKGMLLAIVLMVGMVPAVTVSAGHEEFSEAANVAIAHLGVDPEGVRVTDEYTSAHNGVTHVYLRQLEDGVDVAGAEATVNVQDGIAIHSGSRFLDSESFSGAQALTPRQALEAAAATIHSEVAEVMAAPTLIYRVLDDGSARLAYDMQIQTLRHWWNLSVDAANGRIVYRADFVDSENAGHIAASTARQEDAHVAQELVSAMEPPQQAGP